MRVYALKDFYKEATKEDIKEEHLCEAVHRAENGSVDVNLGRFLIKQRIAREGQGRSGGFRAAIFYQRGEIGVMMHLFAKKDRSNLTSTELATFRDAVDQFDRLDETAISKLVQTKRWIELDYERYQKELSKRTASVDPPGRQGSPSRRGGR